MPDMIPNHTVIFTREVDGKTQRVIPEIGKPFAFTEKEIESILAVNKDALTDPANPVRGRNTAARAVVESVAEPIVPPVSAPAKAAAPAPAPDPDEHETL